MLLEGIDIKGLVWVDELSWQGVKAEVVPSLAGTPIVFEDATAGRPVTLQGKPDEGWLTRAQLIALKSLASVPRSLYTLTYNGKAYTVRFRHEDAPPIEASPLVGRENAADGDYYNNVVIKLMEV